MSNHNLADSADSGNSNSPQKFVFDSGTPAEIRVLDIDGEPWFIASDVCQILGLDYITKALARLDPDEKRKERCSHVNNTYHELWVVNESGLYSLILTSRKPEAKAFKKWITSEVLPSIRKTGSYSTAGKTKLELLLESVQAMVEHERQLQVHEDRITRLEAKTDAAETGLEYFTILGWFKYIGKPAPENAAVQGLGRRASNLSRKRGYPIGQVHDQRYGMVHTYHQDILATLIPPVSLVVKGGQ